MDKPESLNAVTTEQAELNQLLLDDLAPIAPTTSQQSQLLSKLLQRTANSLSEEAGRLTVRSHQGVWQNLTAGIRYKQLWQGFEGNSVLIEFAAGASLSAHRHQWLEEGMVLRGRLQMGDLDLGPLDYHLSSIGSRHAKIQSQQGALAYLRGTSLGDKTSVLKEFLGGLLPHQGQPSLTVYTHDESAWQTLAPGVSRKQLYTDGKRTSCFYRLAAEAEFSGILLTQAQECMVLQGEVFLGDQLLQACDYQVALEGSRYRTIFSDVGAVLFMRGAS